MGIERDMGITANKSDDSQKIWWLNSPSKEQMSQEHIDQQKAFVDWAEQIVDQNNLTSVHRRLEFEEDRDDCNPLPE